MFILENILCFVVLFFPLHIYYFMKTNSLKIKPIYLDISLYIIMFIYYGITKNNIITYLIFMKFPIIISRLIKRNILINILSIITVIILNQVFKINILVLILEYLIYFLLKDSNQYKLLYFGLLMNLYAIKEFTIINILYTTTIYLFLIKATNKYIATINNHSPDNYINKLAHEVKNPLSVCKGYIEMLKKSPYKDKYLNIIDNELERSITIINDFNKYSKKKKLNIEEVDIVFLLEDITELLEPLFKNNDASIQIETNDEIYVNADYNRLKEVFINILKNTIEAKKTNENLQVKINIKNHSNKIKITIEDNGIGMKKENLNHLFEIFYTTKPNGTGLGILYSKEIIELHGGSIKYQSKYNVGTKVLIDIPKIDYNHTY